MLRQQRWTYFFLVIAATVGQAPVDAQSPPQTSVQITAFSAARYELNQWAPLGLQAVNGTDQGATGLLSVYFGNEINTQFARQLWVPAKSVRRTWLPVRMPSSVPEKRESVDMSMMLLRASSGGDVLERKAGMELRRTALLPLDRELVQTAAIYRLPALDERGYFQERDRDAYDVLVHMRQLAQLSRVISELADDLVPAHPTMWETLDQLVVCSDRITDDSAGLATIRDWLHRGGRILIFLDRVNPDTVSALLGHQLSYREVDRVELNDFAIEGVRQPTGTLARDRRNFEEPVEFVRVVADRVEVACHIQGWPAAFWQRVGRGEVLFLTLGAPGWLPAPIGPSEEKHPHSLDPEFRDTVALRSIIDRFFLPREPGLELSGVVESGLQEQIGYRIPKRRFALGLLSLHGLLLLVVGLWCGRRQRLDRLAWIVPIAALAVAGVFIAIGRTNSRSVPDTVAFTEAIEVFSNTGDARVTGIAALYQQSTSPLTMTGGQSGMARPLSRPTEGATRRLVWGDEDRGHWENVTLPAGSVQFVKYERTAKLPSPIEAVARFGAEGLEGRVVAPNPGEIRDAVIANPPALPLAVRVRADGTFSGNREAVLPAGQYLADRVLSDDNRRHQEVYRGVLDPADKIAFPVAAAFVGWSPPIATGIDWPEGLQQAGATLIAVPLRMERTPAGQPFAVPATFIRPEVMTGKSGQSMTYNDRTGQWLKALSLASRTNLRFPMPPEVLPCRLTSARLAVKLNAPSRSLAIYTVQGDDELLLQSIPNPNGVYQFDIEQPERLRLDDQGGLLLTIEVTESGQEVQQRRAWDQKPAAAPAADSGAPQESDRPTSFTTWQIDYVRLDIRGTTL